MELSEVVIPKRTYISPESFHVVRRGRTVITSSRCSQGFLFGDSEMEHLCECGCGKAVTVLYGKPRRFVSGHNKGNLKNRIPPKPKFCACGCGEFAKSGNDYIFNHHWLGKSHTKEAKEKVSAANSNPSIEKRKRLKAAAKQRELLKSERLGLTQSKYCDAWEDHEYRNDLRGPACETCGITNMMCMKVSSMQLSTHHKNGKGNCSPEDIQTVCTSCHMRLESKFRTRGHSARFV
jgi:hypothetical protein